MKNKNFNSSRQNFNLNGSKTYFKNTKLKNILSWLLIGILCLTVIGSMLGTVAFVKTQTAHADVVVEDNKYYYEGSNFFVPLTTISQLTDNPMVSYFNDNLVNFKTDISMHEQVYNIGENNEVYNANLALPTFTAFSNSMGYPFAVEYDGQTYLPDNNSNLTLLGYNTVYNKDENNIVSYVNSVSEISNDTYFGRQVYLVQNYENLQQLDNYDFDYNSKTRAASYSIGPCWFVPKSAPVISESFSFNFGDIGFYSGVNYSTKYNVMYCIINGSDITLYYERTVDNEVYTDVAYQNGEWVSSFSNFALEQKIGFNQSWFANFLAETYNFYDLPTYGGNISFSTQVGFNCDIVSIEFRYDVSAYTDDIIRLYNEVVYRDRNGYKFTVLFPSYYYSDTPYLYERYALQNRIYYLDNAFNSDINFQLGYDEGFLDGSDTAVSDYKNSSQYSYDARNDFYNAYILEYKQSSEYHSEISNAKWAGALEERENGGNYNFVTVLSAMYNAPLGAFRDFLSFELLGVDMLGFFTGLFTIAFVLFVVRKLT